MNDSPADLSAACFQQQRVGNQFALLIRRAETLANASLQINFFENLQQGG